MAKIELTVEASYVKWGLWEACREFMQNGLDAQKDGATFEVKYAPTDETLRIHTKGAALTTRSLLLGSSTKKDRPDQIGQFGEGYKLALLALVNHGHPVRILTGDESWAPAIEQSRKFGGAPVLVVHRTKRRAFVPEVDVWISGVTQAQWDEIQPRFLAIVPAARAVDTFHGEILFDERLAGLVFVGGIFIEKIADLKYGYNLPPHLARVDRDRRMVDRWDIEYHAANAWIEAVLKDEKLAEDFFALLSNGAEDVKTVRYSGAGNAALRKAVAARFIRLYGEGALPVASEAEAEQARSLGKRGVVVPEAMRVVLEQECGTLATAREAMRTKAAREFGIADLTPDEAQNWTRAVTLISAVRPHLRLAQFRIVEFPDDGLLGLWKAEPGTEPLILVARKTLGSFRDVLCTAVHEVAHDTSGGAADASCDFEHALQNLWADIVAHLSK